MNIQKIMVLGSGLMGKGKVSEDKETIMGYIVTTDNYEDGAENTKKR